MTWHGHLRLHYRRDDQRTTALDRHHGPLRVLQRLYPEGPGICHHVLVHPPGGIVGGDVLEIDAELDAHTHALITTPGATRFYRSLGPLAEQRLRARVSEGARLEWLPLETIAYPSCHAANHLRFELDPGAEMLGWDMLALGLPAAGQPWHDGTYLQHLELPGVWLERAQLQAQDRTLLDGALGWAGHGVLATAWFAAGTALAGERRSALLEAARAAIDPSHPDDALAASTGRRPDGVLAGVTSAHDEVVVLRALAPRVEPALRLLMQVRAAWRHLAWQLPEAAPRVWGT